MAAPSTAEKMSEAYLIYSEWGPARATPRAERLATCFPDETAVLRAAWIEEFERINAEIWRIAAEGGPRTISFARFKKRLKAAFPFLNDAALQRAWTLTGYYTAHEGY
jgi:hypothetical protein